MTTNDQKLIIYRPMKYWWLYFVISFSVIIPGSFSLFTSGLKLGADFTGGTSIVWKGDVSEEIFKEKAEALQIEIRKINHNGNVWTLETNPIEREVYQKFKPEGVQELSYDTTGPSLGSELIKKTIYGLILAAALILLYVAYRFKNFRYGTSAILAMLHDLLIVLGIFSLLKLEIDTLFVTALLTILSFSVHDTIVVYDRIRELKKKHAYLDFEDIVNRAVVETMGRSINNSMTIIFMLLALFLMGGETIHWFIFALLIGTISGTYSSTFTAAPILIFWDKLAHRRKS